MKPVTLVGDSPTDCVFVEKVQEKVMRFAFTNILRNEIKAILSSFFLSSSILLCSSL